MESTDIKKAALTFLTQPGNITAVIGSCPPDGNAHAATVYYYVDANFNFYFLTAVHTEKYQNLLLNPNAAIVVGFGPAYTTIQGQGVAKLLEKASKEEKSAIAHIKERLKKHDDVTWPVFQLDVHESDSIAVFQFIPEKLQLLNLVHNSGLAVTEEDILQIL